MSYKFMHRFVVGCMLLLLPAVAAAQGPGSQAYKEGYQLFKNDNYQGAIDKFNKAINLESTNYKYYYVKGLAYIRLASNEKESKSKREEYFRNAMKAFDGATDQNSDFSKGFLYNAKIAMQVGDKQKAVNYLQKATQAEGNKSKKLQYNVYTAKLLTGMGKPQQALQEIQEAKDIAPEDSRVLMAEGEIYMDTEQYSKAADVFQKALERQGDAPKKQKAKTYYKLAFAHFKNGNTKKADEVASNLPGKYQQYYKKKTQMAGAMRYIYLARGYMQAQEYDEALNNIKKAIEANDQPKQSYTTAGMIYYKRGQYDSAIDQFKKAMQSVDSKEEKQKYQKYILQLANKANNSQEMLNAANDLMKGGENAQILLYKSRALYDMGNYQEAMNAAKRAIEVAEGKQKTSSLYFALGLAAKKAGQIDTAKKAFSKVENGVLSFVAKQEVKSMN